MSLELAADIARRRANAAVLPSTPTGALINNHPAIIAAMHHVTDFLVLQGALPVRATGSLNGAIGVRGAPGGERDEICVRKQIEAAMEAPEFAN
jgi:uncharacterized protein GlcG (DUF336 family)